jgi:BirA family transcriptional regulator, biotin operon repressor / biotin---[acetyl-CoA-carboxylase] ligase
MNMVLTAEQIQSKLAPRALRFYEQADSTNDLALDWLRAGAVAGSAVIADEQVKGRGRLGRMWYTPPGTALILSVVLRPKVEYLGQITILGAVAIAEMIEHLGTTDVAIKWPNDVLLQDKKVSGVLSEAVWNGDQLQGVVLGMGINVRIDFSGTELADTATSIEPALGHGVDRLVLLADLLGRVDYWYERLQTGALFDAWKSRLNMLGKMVTVQGGTLHGFADSVDGSGALLLRDESGQLHRVVAGDIGLGS